MSPPAARRDDSAALWAGELADVRERLARLETRAEAHDKASAERQKAVLDAIREVEERLGAKVGAGCHALRARP